MRYTAFIFIFIIVYTGSAQICQFPYIERFDSITVPELPPGWESTIQRSPTGDFVTVQSSAYSDSIAVVSTNAKIEQCFYSPLLDFSQIQADSLTFYERRSASHNSDILVEASIDGGLQYLLPVSDTLRNPMTTSYVYRSFKLPEMLSGHNAVRIRWRVVGNGTGTSGTVRFDDIYFSALHAVDAAVAGLEIDPPFPITGDDVRIGAIIKNAGLTPLTGIRTEIYADINDDGFSEPSEILTTEVTSRTLNTGETLTVWCRLPQVSSGLQRIIVTCYHEDDTNTSNDSGKYKINIGYPPMTIIINEIMYDPLSRGTEYIEIINPGEDRIDIMGWKLSDEQNRESRSARHVINDTARYIDGGEFIIVASDSSIYDRFPYLRDSGFTVFIRTNSFSLSNEGDDIILSDRCNRCIDSVHYDPTWHNPYIEDCTGRSLERVNPRHGSNDRNNWGTSAGASGGTPALMNSLFTTSLPKSTVISSSPNPFSPDGDGYEDLTIVQYHLTANISLIRLRIFDARGRLIRTLADGEPSGPHGEQIWDGYNEKRQRVRIGLYVVLLEALDANGTTIESVKSVIAVAAKM